MKKYHKPMMATAYIWANQSSCTRKQVGAILSKKGRIISNGYNGTVVGADNCCEDEVFDKVKVCPNCGHGNFWDTDAFGLEDGKHCKSCDDKYDGKNLKIKLVPRLVSKGSVVHAEANALTFAAKHGLKTKGCSMYITLSPCIECAKLMKQAGIKKVFYAESYREDEGVQFLLANGVKVKKYDV